MAFVEDGLVRLVIEGTFDVLKFGKIVTFEIAQHRLRAKRTSVAILDETGLSFHDLPIIIRPHGILRLGHYSTSACIAIAFN